MKEKMEKILIERRNFLKFAGATVITGPLATMFPQAAPAHLEEPSTQGTIQVGGLPANPTSLHWQWEWPCWVPGAGEQFNMQAFISGVLETGVQVLHIATRAEPGVYHYPTQIGFERDCTGRDWVSEVLEEIQRQRAEDRLKVILYFTATVDHSAAKERPAWRQVNKDGVGLYLKDMFGQRQWDFVCFNSPWRDYFLRIMNEAAELYADRYPGVVGLYVDEPHFAPQGCYCAWCREGFRSMYGSDLPRDFREDRTLWMNMHRFQMQSLVRFLEDVNREVISRRPELVWTWNAFTLPSCNWDPRVWQVAPYNCQEVELGYLWAIAWSKRLSSYGRPFELAFGRDNSWTQQMPRPLHELKTLQGISVAHGGGVDIGDYPYPSGNRRASGLTWGNDMLRWKNAIQPWLDGAKNLSEVALFDSWDSNWVRFVRSFNQEAGIWDTPVPCDPAFFVWAKLLTAANIQFDVISENNLDRLSRYKTVILPDLLLLEDPTVQALDQYVQAGGNLLSTFRTGLYDINGMERPSTSFYNLLGVRFRQWSNYACNYMWIDDTALKQNLIPEPLFIFGTAMLCEATTAQPLARVTFPIDELTPDTRVWFNYNPPRDNPEPFPSIALNRRGRGQVLSIFHAVEEAAYNEEFWAAERLLLNALARLGPEPLIKVTACGEVLAITTIQEGRQRVVVHLLNEALWIGDRFLTNLRSFSLMSKQGLFPWKRPLVSNVQVELRVPFTQVARVYEAPSRRNIPFQVVEGKVRFIVPAVDTHTMVAVEQ
jgi:hypothetical protein